MLNEEQQAAPVTVTGAQVVVALQVISRLTNVGNGALKDVELSAVGACRDGLAQALETATGVNFDQARAQAEALQRQRIAELRKAQAEAQAAAQAEAEAQAADAEEESVDPSDTAVS